MVKQRRKPHNKTGIDRIHELKYPANDAWASYVCLNCGSLNLIHVGDHLLSPDDTYEHATWICSKCGFVHSKDSSLPAKWKNWNEQFLTNGEPTVENFWRTFFKFSTYSPEVYWKQCNVCGRILPYFYFAKHIGWGPLEKQMECRACKASINALLNPKRTTEQHRESSARRRFADMLIPNNQEKFDLQKLFKDFNNRCFKTKKILDINDPSSYAVDHILPQKFLWPLTQNNACLLSTEANANKRDTWPSKFYSPKELIELAQITGADLALLSSPKPIYNTNIDVNKAVDRFLTVRNSNDDMVKRIDEVKHILESYDLIDKLDPKHKSILGY